jgi:hypothetical protein
LTLMVSNHYFTDDDRLLLRKLRSLRDAYIKAKGLKLLSIDEPSFLGKSCHTELLIQFNKRSKRLDKFKQARPMGNDREIAARKRWLVPAHRRLTISLEQLLSS